MKVAVLISGRGSNLQALIDACRAPHHPAEIVLVISNDASAFGLERAAAAGIPTRVIDHRDYSDRPHFDGALDAALVEFGVDLVCLAGFMRLLTEGFVVKWMDRLINIHPSLLPAFKGLDVHRRVVDSGVRFSGCTIHFVRPAMDDGPILAQAVVPVHSGDDAQSLAARVLALEHRLYPWSVCMIAAGKVRVSGGRVHLDGAESPTGALFNPGPSGP